MQDSEENNTPNATESILDQAAQLIGEADKIVREEPRRWQEALQKLDSTIELLGSQESDEPDRQAQLSGWALMGRGNILANTNLRPNLDKAIAAYEQALSSFETIPDRKPAHEADIAALLGNIGHTRFRTGEPEQLEEAKGLYRRAIGILEALPWKETPRFRHHLAATWLNLANTLSRAGKPSEPTEETIAAFDKALDLTNELAAEDHGFAVLRANIRSSAGRALQWSATKEHLERAVRELEQAIQILEKLPFKENASLAMELAAAHGNRASLLSRAQPSKASIQATLHSGEVALKMTVPNEQGHLYAAEIALNARRAICHTFGMIIGSQEPKAREEIQDKATDLVEDGLKIADLWEKRQATGLRPAAQHLFHLGCAFYSTQQPQFLGEFVGEYLKTDDTVMRDSAQKAIKRALETLERDEKTDPALVGNLKARLNELAPA